MYYNTKILKNLFFIRNNLEQYMNFKHQILSNSMTFSMNMGFVLYNYQSPHKQHS